MSLPQTQASVFIGTSLDGFIARPDGALDFLPTDGGEPHGYNEFFASVDALVIGRGTFETVCAFPEWPYGNKLVIVLSTRPLDLPQLGVPHVSPGLRDVGTRNVEQMSGDPAEIIAKLSTRGIKHIYVDGGVTIQKFLRAGLIQRLIITRVPVLIGQGIPLFASLQEDVRLRHVHTTAYESGLVKSEYEVLSA